MGRIGIISGAAMGHLALQLMAQPTPAITNTEPAQTQDGPATRAERRRAEKAARKEAERAGKRQRQIMGRNCYE